jgi:hypothetical protein
MSNTTHTVSSHTASQQRADERKISQQLADKDRINNLLNAVLRRSYICCPNKNCTSEFTAETVEAQIEQDNIVRIICGECKPKLMFKSTDKSRMTCRTFVCLGCRKHNQWLHKLRGKCSCDKESHDHTILDACDVDFADGVVTESKTLGNDVISPRASVPNRELVDSNINMDQEDEADSMPPLAKYDWDSIVADCALKRAFNRKAWQNLSE